MPRQERRCLVRACQERQSRERTWKPGPRRRSREPACPAPPSENGGKTHRFGKNGIAFVDSISAWLPRTVSSTDSTWRPVRRFPHTASGQTRVLIHLSGNHAVRLYNKGRRRANCEHQRVACRLRYTACSCPDTKNSSTVELSALAGQWGASRRIFRSWSNTPVIGRRVTCARILIHRPRRRLRRLRMLGYGPEQPGKSARAGSPATLDRMAGSRSPAT